MGNKSSTVHNSTQTKNVPVITMDDVPFGNVEKKLKKGADPNFMDDFSNGTKKTKITPLFACVHAYCTTDNQNCYKNIEQLLEYGADRHGHALTFALSYNNYKLIDLLMNQKGPNIDVSDNMPVSYHAALCKNDFFFNKGGDINHAALPNNVTALMAGATKGNLKTVSNILEYGPDINAVDINGFNALGYALTAIFTEHGSIPVVQKLINEGIEVDEQLLEELELKWSEVDDKETWKSVYQTVKEIITNSCHTGLQESS